MSPLVFGANHRWASAGAGSADPQTGRAYDAFTSQVKTAGVSAIRYPGGTLAGAFHFERALGPQAQRTPQVAGSVAAPVPLDSAFGPDEFGDLLERTGATGVLVANFGTATPAEAASFAAYLTLPAGAPPVNGVDWGAKRAANGHLGPYPIQYIEIGNEPALQNPDQRYWMSGEAIGIEPSCAADGPACLYAFGGTTRFTRQAAVSASDWRYAASRSDGSPGQAFLARFPPIAPGSLSLFVGGAQWQETADLGAAAATSTVYLSDAASGRITFGDGVHGAIPPADAAVSLTYDSGRHGGFVDYYKALKAVNPGLKVCATYDSPAFLRLMGAAHAYDCHSLHPYQGAAGLQAADPADAFGELVLLADAASDVVSQARAEIAWYAGARAPDIEVVITEYGLLSSGLPSSLPHLLRSEGMGLLQAVYLKQWLALGVPLAMRQALTDFTFGAAPAGLEAFFVGDQALLQGPGPGTVPSPSALAFELFRAHTGARLVSTEVLRSPVRLLGSGSALPALDAVATIDDRFAYLLLLNRDPQDAVEAVVSLRGAAAAGLPAGRLLTSASLTDDDTPAEPGRVALTDTSAEARDAAGNFRCKVPAHSVAAFRLALQ